MQFLVKLTYVSYILVITFLFTHFYSHMRVFIFVAFLAFVHGGNKKCVKWTSKYVDHDGPSMVFAEALADNAGIGQQLFTFAVLWQLRRSYNVDVFISKATHDTLARVFTEESLSDMPVLEDFFCNPDNIVWEFFAGPFEVIATRKEFRMGRTVWLWPSTDVIKSLPQQTDVKGDDYDVKYRGYKIEDHSGSAHEKLSGDYTKWMKRNLKYKPWIEDKVSNTLVTIAKKMDLKPKQVTYIGIHNRRGKDHVALTKRLTQKKPLPKSYFYDAMEDMRESYDNVAFLYVSDVMKWGRKNLKDKENDMYFVGHGDGSDEDNDAYDFALLCSCNHTIVTRGAFSNWVAMWAGGEYYSEYGSIVPNEVNDALEEELAAQRKREGSAGSLVYGSAQTGEPEGLLFPDIKIDGKEGSGGGEDSSWFW